MKALHIDYCNRENFETAIEILSGYFPKVTFTIELTYFDFGQNWMHETIIATRKDSGSRWQVPCPRDWKLIQKGDIIEGVDNIAKQQEGLMEK